MKNLFITITLAAAMTAAQAQKTITLDAPGTLHENIAESEKYNITELKITGPLNGTDVILLRDMAGTDLDNNTTEGQLARLDLSGAQMKAGGEPYYTDYNSMTDYSTADNEMSDMIFFNCQALRSVTLPETTTAIGSGAFSVCESLAEAQLPESLTEISESMFDRCGSLQKINVPEGLVRIGGYAFQNNKALAEFTIPESVTEIGDNAFSNTALAEIVLPKGLTSIGKSAFSGCGNAQRIVLPETLTEIPDNAFTYCEAVKEVTVNEGVTAIGRMAFAQCLSMERLTLPSSLATIGQMTFAMNDNLTEVHCLGPVPATCEAGAFKTSTGDVPEGCTLYVPEGSKEAYEAASTWSSFTDIKENGGTGISLNPTPETRRETMRLDASGRRISGTRSGINIIVYDDGTVKKTTIR